jgi:hypothetical protein
VISVAICAKFQASAPCGVALARFMRMAGQSREGIAGGKIRRYRNHTDLEAHYGARVAGPLPDEGNEATGVPHVLHIGLAKRLYRI